MFLCLDVQICHKYIVLVLSHRAEETARTQEAVAKCTWTARTISRERPNGVERCGGRPGDGVILGEHLAGGLPPEMTTFVLPAAGPSISATLERRRYCSQDDRLSLSRLAPLLHLVPLMTGTNLVEIPLSWGIRCCKGGVHKDRDLR